MKRAILACLLSCLGSISIATAARADDSVVSGGYKLQPGDILQVVVWKETDLQSEVLIRPDGGISFALAGDVQAGRAYDG